MYSIDQICNKNYFIKINKDEIYITDKENNKLLVLFKTDYIKFKLNEEMDIHDLKIINISFTRKLCDYDPEKRIYLKNKEYLECEFVIIKEAGQSYCFVEFININSLEVGSFSDTFIKLEFDLNSYIKLKVI